MPTAGIGRTISVSSAEGNLLLSVASLARPHRSCRRRFPAVAASLIGAGCPLAVTLVTQVSQLLTLHRNRP